MTDRGGEWQGSSKPRMHIPSGHCKIRGKVKAVSQNSEKGADRGDAQKFISSCDISKVIFKTGLDAQIEFTFNAIRSHLNCNLHWNKVEQGEGEIQGAAARSEQNQGLGALTALQEPLDSNPSSAVLTGVSSPAALRPVVRGGNG